MSETKKPLVFGAADPEFARKAASDRVVREEFGRNPFYVPGYSEQVKVNDIASGVRTPDGRGLTSEQKQELYNRFGLAPKPLPFHFTGVRVAAADGGRSHSADISAQEWIRKGYRPVKEEDFAEGGDLAQAGYSPPPAMEKTAEGRFKAWDAELWVVDGERHRINEEEKFQDAKAAEDAGVLPAAFGADGAVARTFDSREPYQKKLSYDPN